MNNEKILFIEICNFSDYPIGGYLSFAKQMIDAFGNQLILVGMSTDETPTGKWIKKKINGVEYDFFSVIKVKKTNKKPLIPARLTAYLAIRKYKKQILSININNVFIQTPEVLFALRNNELQNLCARIPGVENPLSISRYWYAKYFAKIFDHFFFQILKNTKVILASADKKAINNFINRGKKNIAENRIIQFPTRVNTNLFFPIHKNIARNELKLPITKKIVVTTGRLSELKGWKFMIKSFIIFREIHPDSLFLFIGDGEDRKKIEEYILENNLSECVILTGRLEHEKLSLYLNAADIYIMGSYFEGWATSLVEAIACAKPITCTNFSSAKELVTHEFNGYITESHDADLFAASMTKCLNVPYENLLSKAHEMQKYATSNLKDSILENWELE